MKVTSHLFLHAIMDGTDLAPALEDLSTNIDDLEEALAPLLNVALSTSTSKLPLLDKTKLYVLATYAIESLLFNFLRLNSVDAKSHPVFTELTRVKQYFEKIKTAESAGIKPSTTLDKSAATRFIKHGLAGNEKYDRERAEQREKEKAGAKRKFEDMTERVGSQSRFEVMSKRIRAEDEPSSNAEATEGAPTVAGQQTQQDGQNGHGLQQNRKDKKRHRKSKRDGATDQNNANGNAGPSSEAEQIERVAPKRTKSHKAPRGHGEAFQALLNGPIPTRDTSEGGNRKHSKAKSDKGTKGRG